MSHFQNGNTGRPHPPELREAAQKMLDAGANHQQIKRALGISPETLRRWFGPSPYDPVAGAIAAAERRQQDDQIHKEVVRLRCAGKTNAQIAMELDIDPNRVWRHVGPTPRRLGGAPPWPYGKRERARYLRTCGYTIREIAEEMNMSQSTIGDWVYGMPCGE